MTPILFLVMYRQFGDGYSFSDRYLIIGDVDPILVIHILFFPKTVMNSHVCNVYTIFGDVCPSVVMLILFLVMYRQKSDEEPIFVMYRQCSRLW